MQLPAEATAVQQKAYVTFSCLSPSAHSSNTPNEEPTITLLERRHLISGSLTTGYRTWEAALHLGSYLLTSEGSSLIAGKNVLELGAGTGFISVLCAKHLEAKHLTTTDGDEGVIESLKENLFLNELDDKNVNASVLRWGHGLAGSWVEEECETWPYDVVLGADIVCMPFMLLSVDRPLMSHRHMRSPPLQPSLLHCGFSSICCRASRCLLQEPSETSRLLRRSDKLVVRLSPIAGRHAIC